MPLDTKSFDLHRILPLSPDRLWQVLTDAKEREKWNAPDASTLLETETADLRVGGAERHRSGPADAPDFVIDTRWYHLAMPERAVFTETLVVAGEAVFTSLVTYLLDGKDNKTTDLSITVAVSSFCGPDALDEVSQGWAGGLDNLQRFTANIASPN